MHSTATKIKPLLITFWVRMFQMKGISDLVLLTVTGYVKDNLELSWANYVANTYVNTIRLHVSWWSNITDWNKMSQFNGGMTVSLKISLMLWKLLMEKVMIELANTNLLMTKSAIPLTLKDRWCYDNVDATTDVNLCTFDFWKISLPIQFTFRT